MKQIASRKLPWQKNIYIVKRYIPVIRRSFHEIKKKILDFVTIIDFYFVIIYESGFQIKITGGDDSEEHCTRLGAS